MSDASPVIPAAADGAAPCTGALSASPAGGRATAAEPCTTSSRSELVERVLEIADRIRALLGARLATCGLNNVRYEALSAIDRSAPDGCSQTQLAARLQQSESSISTLVDRMRIDGLLYRLRSKSDRRRHLLMLAPQGRELLTRARNDYVAAQAELVAGFDADHAQTLACLLEAWRAALSSPTLKGLPPAEQGPHLDEARTKPSAA